MNKMTLDETTELSQVIKRNRFHLRSDGIRAIANWLETKVEGFDRALWYARIDKLKENQPPTGSKCGCRIGQERDNCPACEGTGWQIDFAKIRGGAK